MGKLLERFKDLSGIERERKIREIADPDIGYRQQDYIELFKICDAIWIHNGNPKGPHAQLVSGLHSDGYINCSKVLKHTNLKMILARRLIEKIRQEKTLWGWNFDYVVSSSMAAITIGDTVATLNKATFVYTEKEAGKQVLKRFKIPKGAVVLQIEELITTLETTRKVTNAILYNPVDFVRDENGKIIVGTIVHRPEKLPVTYKSYKVIPLIEIEIHNWDPKKCPLCRGGSKALKPKENWRLFLKYNKI